MNKLWRNIKVGWHKFFDTGYSEMMGFQNALGKFKVVYPDGKVSQMMSYSTAKSYSNMFGGKVIYWRDLDEE